MSKHVSTRHTHKQSKKQNPGCRGERVVAVWRWSVVPRRQSSPLHPVPELFIPRLLPRALTCSPRHVSSPCRHSVDTAVIPHPGLPRLEARCGLPTAQGHRACLTAGRTRLAVSRAWVSCKVLPSSFVHSGNPYVVISRSGSAAPSPCSPLRPPSQARAFTACRSDPAWAPPDVS